MIEKIKSVLVNQQGVHIIEVIGVTVIVLVLIAVVFNAVKPGVNNSSNRIQNGLGIFTSMNTTNADIQP